MMAYEGQRACRGIMKKLLITGDSLAGGLPHLSYPALLRKMLPGYEFIVSSVAGDTMIGICCRVRELTARHNPDFLVIEGGANDITLPLMQKIGGRWKSIADRLEKRGSAISPDASSFESALADTLDSIKRHELNIIVTTIGCIGENLESEPNAIREKYNGIIRHTAGLAGAKVADVGEAFERVLATLNKPSNYLVGDFRDAFLDTFHMLTPNRAYRLSAKRGLALTVDGIHNNPFGASIYAEVIREALPE